MTDDVTLRSASARRDSPSVPLSLAIGRRSHSTLVGAWSAFSSCWMRALSRAAARVSHILVPEDTGVVRAD